VPAWRLRRPRFQPLEPWQRAQYLVVLTVALAHIGFDVTQPFIPLYVRYLGVTDLADAAIWSGLIVGISPLTGAFIGPLWGGLADRFGRKPMVLRALLMISLLQFVQAAAPDVGWLFGARFVMGLIAGFTPMAMSLAISLGPREQIGRAIGLVQAAQFLPLAISPPIGGLISDTLGLRANFILTGVMLLLPALFLYFMVEEKTYEAPRERPAERAARPRGSLFSALLLPGFAAAIGVLTVTRFTDRTLPTILPLYLVEVDTPDQQLATVTGLVVSGGAVAASLSSMFLGRLARPGTTRRWLMLALAGGALCSAPLALSADWSQVLGLRLLLGLLAGGTQGLAYTIGARLAPAERSAFTLSVLASCGQLGGALAPMVAGGLAQVSLQTVFLANGGAYLLALLFVALMPKGDDRAVQTEQQARPGH
jgi:DHA1 family multidrug resistance protein-like MFS transporter